MKCILKKHDLHIANISSLLAFIIAFWGNYIIIIGDIYIGFMFVLFACFFDILDGYLARKFTSQSHLGNTLDSFSDIFIYILPLPLLYLHTYFFSLSFLLISSLLFSCALLRLSYFTKNGIQTINEKKYYIGLPVYFLFPLAIILFFVPSHDIVYLLFIIFSISMLLDFKIQKANIFISLSYIFLLFFITVMFQLGIL